MVRTGFPEPVRGCLGKFAESLFAAPQFLLGPPGCRDVRHRSDKPYIAGFLAQGASQCADMLHRAIGQQQSIFVIEIPPLPRRSIDGPPHEITIFGMNALNEKVQSRLCRSIALEYPEGFLRPQQFAGSDVPAETAGLAQSLGFGQIRVAMQKPGLDLLLILERRQQVIAGSLERPGGLSLRRAQPVHEERDHQEQGHARQLPGIDRKRIEWGDQIIGESQKPDGGRQQPRTEAAKPCRDHDRAKEERYERLDMQECHRRPRYGKRNGNRQNRNDITPDCRPPPPGFLGRLPEERYRLRINGGLRSRDEHVRRARAGLALAAVRTESSLVRPFQVSHLQFVRPGFDTGDREYP